MENKKQKDAFLQTDLNAISEKLDLEDPMKWGWRSPLSVVFKPHHSSITGNYDINVLIAALEGKWKSVVWHDRRCGFSSIDLDGADDTLMGLIVNVPVRKYGGLWKSRHWFALRRIGGVWYNLDSNLAASCAFKDIEVVKEFLNGMISSGSEILLVMNDNQ
ncbi:cysteine protease [Lithospermum erythrorhizon]|uniref:ubiquitinyl hydrolase 1 n=1 Tax=Lithospermum erythrorhizon TaxID=34254 RepID=A0AAV3RBA2_LITER